MQDRRIAVFAVAALLALIPATGQALTPYSQNFEDLEQSDPGALAADDWLVFGNVFDGENQLYDYGPFPAPNNGNAFCQIVLDEGGDEQGLQQLVVFSDYENTDHAEGYLIESNVFQEQFIDGPEVGQTWAFSFQCKMGNLEGNSTAAAFIKTLDPFNGYILTNFISLDMTEISETWSGYTITIEIDPSLQFQLLQFGFMNTATDYVGSGIFYDNIVFAEYDPTDVPESGALAGVELRQNFPNPFNPRTRIDFDLARPGTVELAVFDVAGRRVATLQQGELDAGAHHVTWNGLTDTGRNAPAGLYRYVLQTAAGRVSRSMVLLK